MSSVSSSYCGAPTYKLDPKNRIAIPTGWRPGEGVALFLLSGHRLELPTIKIYTRETFQQAVQKIWDDPESTEAQKDIYVGRMHARCEESTINGQGKLLIPKHMCEFAHLKSDVKLAARGPYFELWEPSLYTQVCLLEDESIIQINNKHGIL